MNEFEKKPLSEYTLGELKDYCIKNYASLECKTKRCFFSDICDRIESRYCWVPANWDLSEKSCWTEEEVALARLLYQEYPEGIIIRTVPKGLRFKVNESATWQVLPSKLFPSIGLNLRVKLSDIYDSMAPCNENENT